jgi:hypothetical protein
MTAHTVPKGLPLVDNRTAAPALAAATAPDSSPGSTTAEGSLPVDTSPLQPTEADQVLLSFAQRMETSIRDLYDVALDAGVADDELGAVVVTIRENHEEYANTLSGLLGVDAPQRRDEPLFEAHRADFETSDLVAVAAAGYELESLAVATNLDIVGRLEGLVGAKSLTSLLMVESEHCTVLADLAGQGDDLAALLDNTADTALPVSATTGTTEG